MTDKFQFIQFVSNNQTNQQLHHRFLFLQIVFNISIKAKSMNLVTNAYRRFL